MSQVIVIYITKHERAALLLCVVGELFTVRHFLLNAVIVLKEEVAVLK